MRIKLAGAGNHRNWMEPEDAAAADPDVVEMPSASRLAASVAGAHSLFERELTVNIFKEIVIPLAHEQRECAHEQRGHCGQLAQ